MSTRRHEGMGKVPCIGLVSNSNRAMKFSGSSKDPTSARVVLKRLPISLLPQTVIDLKGLCAFCLTTADSNFTGEAQLKKFKDCWPHLKPNGWIGPSPSFAKYKAATSFATSTTSNIPPVCKSCVKKVEQISKCHLEIVDLQKKIDELKQQVDSVVGNVRAKIESRIPTVGLRALKRYASRFDPFTIRFLEGLRDGTMVMTFPTSIHLRPNPSMQKKKRTFDETVYSPTLSPLPSPPSSMANSPFVSDGDGEDTVNFNYIKEESEDEENRSGSGNSSSSSSSSSWDSDSDFDPDNPSSRITGFDLGPEKPKKLKTKRKRLSVDVSDAPVTRKSLQISREHTCVICDDLVPFEDNYQHMRAHVGDYVFQCSACKLSFPSRFSATFYERHRLSRTKAVCEAASSPQDIICEVCGEAYPRNKIRYHFEGHETQEKNYTCPITSCGKTFTLKQTVEFHLRSHERPVISQKLAKIKKDRKATVEETNDEFGFYRKCEICAEAIPISKALGLEHMKTHVGDFAFPCPLEKCNLVFLSKYSGRCLSKKHLKEDCSYVPPPNVCDTCGKEFPHLWKFMTHLKRHETFEKNFECPISTCEETFTTKQSLEVHLRSHAYYKAHKKVFQPCLLCDDRKFKTWLIPEEMEIHLEELHEIKDFVKCKYCPFVFPSRDELLEHKVTHIPEGGVTCDLCASSTFTLPVQLRNHYYDEHRVGMKYLCEFCDFTSFVKKSLKLHKMKVHEGKLDPRFRCDICDDKPTFAYEYCLETHNIKMHGAEPYKCKFCAETFNWRSDRDSHEKYEHLGVERPKFLCSICGTTLSCKAAFNYHLNNAHADSSVRNFKCSECDKRYKTQKGLNFHVKLEHDKVRHLCQVCGQGYRTPKNLRDHMRIHTGEKPFTCHLCGRSFRLKSGLYNHSKTHQNKGSNDVPVGTSFDETQGSSNSNQDGMHFMTPHFNFTSQ